MVRVRMNPLAWLARLSAPAFGLAGPEGFPPPPLDGYYRYRQGGERDRVRAEADSMQPIQDIFGPPPSQREMILNARH